MGEGGGIGHVSSRTAFTSIARRGKQQQQRIAPFLVRAQRVSASRSRHKFLARYGRTARV